MGILQVSKCPVYVDYKHSKDLNKCFIVIGIRTYKHFLNIFKRIKHEKLQWIRHRKQTKEFN